MRRSMIAQVKAINSRSGNVPYYKGEFEDFI